MRSRNMTGLLAAALALALVLGAAGCTDPDDRNRETIAGQAQVDLVVGDVVPLTGSLAGPGLSGQKAAGLAIEEINRAIAEVGADHTAEIIHSDTGSDPQGAVRAALETVAGGASCIVGGWSSPETLTIAERVSIPRRILQISPTATADRISDLDDRNLVNRVVQRDSSEAPALADAIAADLGGATGRIVNIGARDDDYGNVFADRFADAWESLGGEIGEDVRYDPTQIAFAREARQLTAAAPDAFVIADFPRSFARVGGALERTGAWDPSRAWGTARLAPAALAIDAGPGVVEGMRGTVPGMPRRDPAALAFAELFAGSAPEEVGRSAFDAQRFDATILCYLAAVAAGSTDGREMAAHIHDVSAPGGAVYTWEQLPEAIEALQAGKDIDYKGVSGQIDLNEDGDATRGVYGIYRHSGGGVEIVGRIDPDAPSSFD